MATTYTLYFTDTNKIPFSIQPYTANGPVSPSDPSTIEGATKADTTLKLYGRGMKDYGEGIFQNMVYMLENFASVTAPINALEGQLWYDTTTATGSPSSQPKLAIYNDTGWDGVILATGSSAMTGELTLAGNPINPNHAVPLSFLSNHKDDFDLHLTPIQNTYLDDLNLDDVAPFLTADETNQLIGINTVLTIQDQFDVITDTTIPDVIASLDEYVIKSDNNIMGNSGHITFSTGGITFNGSGGINFIGLGEILGLGPLPSGDTAAASKKYVDDSVIAVTNVDGVLQNTSWSNVVTIGSPPLPAPNPLDTTLGLIVSDPGNPDKTIYAEGIARSTHSHIAGDISIDITSSPVILDPINYGNNIQSSLEYIELNKVNLLNPIFPGTIRVDGNIIGTTGTFTGQVTGKFPTSNNELTTKEYVDSVSGGGNLPPPTAAAPSRQFDILATDLTIGTTFEVKSHSADDNTLYITVNGIKQYLATRARQDITFYDDVIQISGGAPTGLDINTQYVFGLEIDGGAVQNITIAAAVNVSTHAALGNAMENALAGAGAPATYNIINTSSVGFISNTQNSLSSVTISNQGIVFPDVYLFTAPTIDLIVTATFISDQTIPADIGSPVATPDTIEIAGDFTTIFAVGVSFAIRGSVDPNTNYLTYDELYSVHATGSTFDGTNTIIPIALQSDSNLNIPLFPGYSPGLGDPAPAPTNYGSIYLSPLLAMNAVSTELTGLDGDYIETDILGAQVPNNTTTSYVVFNYDILAGSSIESLSFG